jgi:hypothetical protein
MMYRVLMVAVVLAVAACAPRDYLREDYMGKRYLQPDRFPQHVKHDANGNAIVETERRRGLLSNLPTLRLPSIPLPNIDLPDLWPFGDEDEDES